MVDDDLLIVEEMDMANIKTERKMEGKNEIRNKIEIQKLENLFLLILNHFQPEISADYYYCRHISHNIQSKSQTYTRA